MNNKEKITIYDKQYSITGDATYEEIVRYAEYIEEKIDDILGGKRGMKLNVDILMLTALNMAEELFKVKSERDEALEVIREKEKAIEEYNSFWEKRDFESSTIVIDYEGVKDEIMGLEKECERARKEAEELKIENAVLNKKIESLYQEVEEIKNRNLQMQLFIPETEK